MKIEIKNRWTGAVIYSCELSAEVAGKEYSVQLGFAVRSAVASGANLSGADLSQAVLSQAVLRDTDLSGADLRDADLRGADLSGANLRGANLRGADLSGADLSQAVLSQAVLSQAVLSQAVLRDTDLSGCPITIPDIHRAVYEAASGPGALDMSTWHCGTAHCRAGWVVTLAGEGGKALEWAMGTPTAAAVIYMASDPSMEKIPNFYCDNDTALADMKRLAEQEASP